MNIRLQEDGGPNDYKIFRGVAGPAGLVSCFLVGALILLPAELELKDFSCRLAPFSLWPVPTALMGEYDLSTGEKMDKPVRGFDISKS